MLLLMGTLLGQPGPLRPRFHSGCLALELLLGSVDVTVAWPWDAADVAELVATPAFHPAASLIPLDHHFALYALPVAQVVFEELHFVLVALPLVDREHAFPAEGA